LFSGLAFAVSWWHWWTFQYGTFDLAFYVQALWLALRGKWMVSLLNVPLMGNHAEPIVFLLTPLFAIWPHPMMFVAVQTLAFASMPFTAWRIGKRLQLQPAAALLLALATLVTPATFSIAIYEFHPEALAAPLLLLLIEARLAGRYRWFWVWFIAVLGVKENMAPLLAMYCGVMALLEWRERRKANPSATENSFESRSALDTELEGTAPSVLGETSRSSTDGAVLASSVSKARSIRHSKSQLRWNILPALLAMAWLLIYGKVISPALNAGNVDYIQLYGHLGSSPGDIIHKFFTEPHRVFGALHTALTQGNMLPALLLPLLLLPLLRPRWFVVAAPLLLQHMLSYRYSEWSLGAHYPAPFIPLFWVAAAEALSVYKSKRIPTIAIDALVFFVAPFLVLLVLIAPRLNGELLNLFASHSPPMWLSTALLAAALIVALTATAKLLWRFRSQAFLASLILLACAVAHFRFGPAHELVQEIPGMSAMLEEREWKAQMLADIPDNASVTAGLGFLSHLAQRENIISLHHILKGLKTLSTTTYTPPPPGDVVVIDYADTLTFNTFAGYYHPWSHVDATHSIPSSDRLLNDYLRQAHWHTQSRNAVAVLRRGAVSLPLLPGTPLKIDDQTTIESFQITKRLPGAWKIQMTWNFTGERRQFPWMVLVLSDGKRLYPILKGICAPEVGEGRHIEEWNAVFPNWMHAGYHAAFAEFYNGNEAAWHKKLPPHDQTYMITLLDLGSAEIKPGDFSSPEKAGK